MFTFLFFILFLALLALDLPSLLQAGFNKELLIYSLLWVLAFYLVMVQVYHWPFLNPLLDIARRLQGA